MAMHRARTLSWRRGDDGVWLGQSGLHEVTGPVRWKMESGLPGWPVGRAMRKGKRAKWSVQSEKEKVG
jgi:hypothetical protein